MKVKIAYTVDLEDIPKETEKMLQNISPKLKEILGTLENCKKQILLEDIVNAIKSLDQINNNVYESSLILNDCYSILTDYMAAKFPQPQSQSEVVHEEG